MKPTDKVYKQLGSLIRWENFFDSACLLPCLVWLTIGSLRFKKERVSFNNFFRIFAFGYNGANI